MSQKLTQTSEGLALVIGENKLKNLSIDEETPLEVVVENGCLVVRPLAEKSVSIEDFGRKNLRIHNDTFQKLTE